MHSGAFSSSDNPIQLQTEATRLQDAVKENEPASLLDDAELEHQLIKLDLASDPSEDEPAPQNNSDNAKDENKTSARRPIPPILNASKKLSVPAIKKKQLSVVTGTSSVMAPPSTPTTLD